jgi:hypothetical protein
MERQKPQHEEFSHFREVLWWLFYYETRTPVIIETSQLRVNINFVGREREIA